MYEVLSFSVYCSALANLWVPVGDACPVSHSHPLWICHWSWKSQLSFIISCMKLKLCCCFLPSVSKFVIVPDCKTHTMYFSIATYYSTNMYIELIQYLLIISCYLCLLLYFKKNNFSLCEQLVLQISTAKSARYVTYHSAEIWL